MIPQPELHLRIIAHRFARIAQADRLELMGFTDLANLIAHEPLPVQVVRVPNNGLWKGGER